MEIAVQLYTFRKEISTLQGLDKCFSYLNQIGLNKIETATMPEATVLDIYKLAKKNNIQFVSSHSNLNDIKKRIDRLIEEHIVNGSSIIGIGSMPYKCYTSQKALDKFINIMNKAAMRAKEFGIRMSYHNHNREFEILDGKVIYDYMLEHFNENVYMCLDCYWAYLANVDIVKMLNVHSNKMVSIHLKDCLGMEDKTMCAVGNGVIDYKKIIKVAQENGIEYGIIELDISDDPRKDVKSSYEYINLVMEEKNA